MGSTEELVYYLPFVLLEKKKMKLFFMNLSEHYKALVEGDLPLSLLVPPLLLSLNTA